MNANKLFLSTVSSVSTVSRGEAGTFPTSRWSGSGPKAFNRCCLNPLYAASMSVTSVEPYNEELSPLNVGIYITGRVPISVQKDFCSDIPKRPYLAACSARCSKGMSQKQTTSGTKRSPDRGDFSTFNVREIGPAFSTCGACVIHLRA